VKGAFMLITKTKFVLLGLLLLTVPSFGASLTGVVTNAETGTPVAGVLIKIAGTDFTNVTDTDGRFFFSGLPEGKITIVASVIGYEITKKSLDLKQTQNIDIPLKPKVLKGQDIIVTATRAEKGKTPAAFSNMGNEDIKQLYWAQDTPVLLSVLPSVFAYSDAGNGVGYSYLKIRGFDQKRISVMLNGIPLNDAESHEVFWIDLPDFAANVQDIQVQRGVGSSLYGASSMGGSVNLITNDFSAIPQIKFQTGYGSYDTKKLSISGNSGLINDSYVFYGRYSRIETDGYRDNSWTKMYSYFIGLARYDENMTFKFNTYGGPEESHLAYKGIPFEMLDTLRKYNELQYEDEIDHFNQPHYEFIHDWEINDNLELANTIYYFHGEGYYNQKRNRKYIEEYFPEIHSIMVSDTTLAPRDYYDLDDLGYFVVDTSGLYILEKVDLVRRRTVKEYDWGWIPRLALKHNDGMFTFGGEMRIHSGHHFGEVRWASVYPAGLEPNSRYYDYRGQSNTFTIFAHETYNLTSRLIIMANLQYQRHNYKLENDKRFNVTFDRDYDFISPRGGINYQVNENVNVFVNFSTTSRQPAFKDIYDPTDYWSNPYYKTNNFNASGADWEYVGMELKPEKLFDLEFGADFSKRTDNLVFKGSLNIYRMQINDELIPYAGQIDDNGYPISGNAEKTIHQGLELSFDALMHSEFSLTGNLSVNDDHFESYKEYGFDWDIWEPIEYDRSDKRIGGFPKAIANYRLGYILKNLDFGLSGRYVGEQYIDNGEEYKVDAYHVFNADISYDLGRLIGFNSMRITLRANNLADTKYEQAGYIEEDDGLPRYMVGAERNFFVSLSTEF